MTQNIIIIKENTSIESTNSRLSKIRMIHTNMHYEIKQKYKKCSYAYTMYSYLHTFLYISYIYNIYYIRYTCYTYFHL